MKDLLSMSQSELAELKEELWQEFQEFKDRGLSLNMARGKPSPEQLDLSMPMLDVLNARSSCLTDSGMDCRNYGQLEGIPEARQLFGQYMGIAPEETFVAGSSSLTFMFQCLTNAMFGGVYGTEKPWKDSGTVKFLCPVPGYDRHFTMCEFLGIEMINISLGPDGPDMDEIERLVAEDASIKGIWCVPKFSNPLGAVYSDETVRRFARLKPKAPDFRIFWDNAYGMHYVYQDVPLLNLLDECKKAGNPHMVYLFGSTSKFTFPGAGVSFLGASQENIAFLSKQMSFQAISWDKLNMLRHVRFLKDMETIKKLMDGHARLLRPRFDAVLNTLDQELKDWDAGTWTKPEGGYFITFKAKPGCAKRIVQLCKQAGVTLTDAGATHPYHKDPEDAYIRLAPSFPSVTEITQATQLFCIAAKISTLESVMK